MEKIVDHHPVQSTDSKDPRKNLKAIPLKKGHKTLKPRKAKKQLNKTPVTAVQK